MHIIHTESSCGWGGQELRILTEARGLQQRGHRISLLCPPSSNIYKVAPEFDINPTPLSIERKGLIGLFVMMNWLWKNRDDISVINSHSSTDSWLVALALKLLPIDIPIIRTRHVSSPINTKRSTFWLYQKAAAHIVVTGEPLRHQFAEQNKFSMDSMTSVPTGIDLDRFKPNGGKKDTDNFTLGILATLRSWKGHSYLLDAMQDMLLAIPNLNLLIVGDGPQREILEQKSKELGITEQVCFVGNQDNPEEWLHKMDMFILPSYGDEGVSQAVMQAMASRLPVITTDVGGMRDAVQHNVTGLLIETRSASAIANGVVELYKDESKRVQLAQAGYERAQQNFGTTKMLTKMEDIFSHYV